MKKIYSILLTATMVLTAFFIKVNAAMPEESTIMPLYNNVNYYSCEFAINNNTREATLTVAYEAKNGILVDAIIVSYIESYSQSTGKWRQIDIGTANDQWLDNSTSSDYSNTHTTTIHYPGRYRAVVEFTISGTGGAPDVYTYISEDTFP